MSIYEKKSPTDSEKGKEIDNSSPVRPDLAQREKATAAQALVSFKTLESVPPGTESGLVPETSLLEPEHFEDEQPPGPDTGTRLPEATKRSPQSWPKSAFRSLIKRKRKKSHIGHKPKTNDLEAYAIEDSRKGHGRKLPFSHQEITRALSDARKSSQASVLDQYLSLDANKRHMVDDLIENVSRFQPRTLVALNIRSSGTSTPTLIVFLARGSRVEPVRIEYADQWSELPYESCLSWDVSVIKRDKEKYNQTNILLVGNETTHPTSIWYNRRFLLCHTEGPVSANRIKWKFNLTYNLDVPRKARTHYWSKDDRVFLSNLSNLSNLSEPSTLSNLSDHNSTILT